MEAFTPNQWLVVGLAFLLGLILGMFLLAGNKWKRRYKEEVRSREAADAEWDARVSALEAENERLRNEASEMDTLRRAAARDEARHDDRDRPGPL